MLNRRARILDPIVFSTAKKRTSRNAYRHGISSSSILNPAIAKRIDRLARLIVGKSRDRIVLERARTVAHAELDLARVREAKAALIKSVSARGALHASHNPGRLIEAIDLLVTMPTREPQQPTPFEGHCQNYAASIDTRSEPSLGGTALSMKFLKRVSEHGAILSRTIVFLQNEANIHA